MKKLITIIFALMMTLALTACGGTKYYANAAIYAGVESSLADMGITGNTGVELEDDGDCTFYFNGDSQSGTYIINDDIITINCDSNEITGTVKGNEISIEYTDADSTQPITLICFSVSE